MPKINRHRREMKNHLHFFLKIGGFGVPLLEGSCFDLKEVFRFLGDHLYLPLIH